MPSLLAAASSRALRWRLGAATLALAAGASAHQGHAPRSSAAVGLISAQRAAHKKIALAMHRGAHAAGVTLAADTLREAASTNAVTAAAGLAGFEQATPEQIAAGADLALLFLALPPEAGIPRDFYVVRVIGSTGRVQLRNLAGSVIRELEAEIAPAEPGESDGRSVSLEVGDDHAALELETATHQIEVEVPLR